jgi:hypothetical protein
MQGAVAGSAGRYLESRVFARARIAQLVEHLICNQDVGGSIPSAGSTCFGRLLPSSSLGTDLD